MELPILAKKTSFLPNSNFFSLLISCQSATSSCDETRDIAFPALCLWIWLPLIFADQVVIMSFHWRWAYNGSQCFPSILPPFFFSGWKVLGVCWQGWSISTDLQGSTHLVNGPPEPPSLSRFFFSAFDPHCFNLQALRDANQAIMYSITFLHEILMLTRFWNVSPSLTPRTPVRWTFMWISIWWTWIAAGHLTFKQSH